VLPGVAPLPVRPGAGGVQLPRLEPACPVAVADHGSRAGVQGAGGLGGTGAAVPRGPVGILGSESRLGGVASEDEPQGTGMAIKTIPLSRLEMDLKKTLNDCADSGQTVVVELPDQRLIAIQPLDPQEDDTLIDELLASNAKFQELVARSKRSARKPFATRDE